jgi:hypothetical protein
MALSLAAPGLVLAKWTVDVSFEPTDAVAGEPSELAAVIELEGHAVEGSSAPTLAEIETVQFRLTPAGGGESIVVAAVADPDREGRYRAEVALPNPGAWEVGVEFVVDGERMSHSDFPGQQRHRLTVHAFPDTAADAAPPPNLLGVALLAGAVISGLAIAYRQLRRRTRAAQAA